MTEERNYFGDISADYQSGCRIDLRFKLALDLLKARAVPNVLYEESPGGTLYAKVGLTPKQYAEMALSIAAELVSQSQERGWLKDMPDHDEPGKPAVHQIRRQVALQVEGQLHGQRLSEEQGSRVFPARRS